VQGERIPPRDLSTTTRAENFDAYSGIRLVDESKASCTAVGSVAAGEWICFQDTALTGHPATFTARVAQDSAGTAPLHVRLDSPTGPLLGTPTVPGTGDRYTYTAVSAPLAAASGRRDVYPVLGADIRLSVFTVR